MLFCVYQETTVHAIHTVSPRTEAFRHRLSLQTVALAVAQLTVTPCMTAICRLIPNLRIAMTTTTWAPHWATNGPLMPSPAVVIIRAKAIQVWAVATRIRRHHMALRHHSTMTICICRRSPGETGKCDFSGCILRLDSQNYCFFPTDSKYNDKTLKKRFSHGLFSNNIFFKAH